MKRYIDADKLQGRIIASPLFSSFGEDGWFIKDFVIDLIGKQPAADVVEVRHGYWEETTHITESKSGREIHSTLYNCSVCHAPNGRRKDLYCRWCGAKMDGERKEK